MYLEASIPAHFESDLAIPSPDEEPEPIPPFPTCSLCLAVSMFVVGISTLLFGLILSATEPDAVLGASLWVAGAMLAVPGVFYSAKFIQALNTWNPADRIRLLKDLPQL